MGHHKAKCALVTLVIAMIFFDTCRSDLKEELCPALSLTDVPLLWIPLL